MRLNQTDLFSGEGAHWGVPAPSNQLLASHWPPSMEGLTEAWQDLLRDFWGSSTGSTLDKKVSACLAAGQVIFPDSPYRALALTPFEKVQVVVLGQDPYHGPDQAQGLAFSVGADQKIPPSLRNIFKEIQRDLGAPIPLGPDAGSLVRWAEQGVLLLNTALTVEQSIPASHSDWGWEVLTDQIIQALSDTLPPGHFEQLTLPDCDHGIAAHQRPPPPPAGAPAPARPSPCPHPRPAGSRGRGSHR
mgnify:CR=1 FL=1